MLYLFAYNKKTFVKMMKNDTRVFFFFKFPSANSHDLEEIICRDQVTVFMTSFIY